MSRIDGMSPLRRVPVNGQFEFVERPPMAGGMRAGAVREFDDSRGHEGRFGQVRDMHGAARIKM